MPTRLQRARNFLAGAALATFAVFCRDTNSPTYPGPTTERDARAARAKCEYKAGALPATTIGNDVQAQLSGLGDKIPIQYVFVLMLENRSFDSYFGRFRDYLANVAASDPSRASPATPQTGDDPRLAKYQDQEARDGQGRPIGVDVPGTAYDQLADDDKATQDRILTPNANTRAVAPYNPSVAGTTPADRCQKHYWRHANDTMDDFGRWRYAADLNGGEQCVADTCHEWWCSHMEWDSGRMDGFFQANDGYFEGAEPDVGYPPSAPLLSGDRAMMYYDWNDIPFYYWLADNFALADHYHASILGPTFPNRDYLYAATSRGITSNASQKYGASAVGGGLAFAGSQTGKPITVRGKTIDTIYDDLRYGGADPVRYTQWVRARYPLSKLGTTGGSLLTARYGAWYGELATTTGIGGPQNTFVTPNGRCDSNAPQESKWVRLGYKDHDFDSLLGSEPGRSTLGFRSWVQRENAALSKLGNGVARTPQCINPVNFIDPDALQDVNGEDEHPPASPQMGQRFVWDVVDVLMSNPEVWKRSVLFITYDEHGGFYDHVKPPPACNPDGIDPGMSWSGAYGGGAKTPWADEAGTIPRSDLTTATVSNLDKTDAQYGGTFDRYGIRVPFIVVSPWAKHRYVSHYTYDHTSILRFIEARFGLPALTARDANADPLLDLFDLSNAEAKLSGGVAGWGTERLPAPNAPFSTVSQLDTGGTFSSANAACTSNFRPATTPAEGGDLGAQVYGGYDWSSGKPPPCHYASDRDDVTDTSVAATCGGAYTLTDVGADPSPSALRPPGLTTADDPLFIDGHAGAPPLVRPLAHLSGNDEVAISAKGPTFVLADGTQVTPTNLPVTMYSAAGEVDAVNDAHMFAGGLIYCPQGALESAVIWAGFPKTIIPLGSLIGDGDVNGLPMARAMAVNNQGHAAGDSSVTSPADFYFHAFFFDGSKMNDLGTLPGGDMSGARAMNDVDTVVGWSDTGPSQFTAVHATLWSAGKALDLTPSFACKTDADCGGCDTNNNESCLVCTQGACAFSGSVLWSMATGVSKAGWVTGVYSAVQDSSQGGTLPHAFVSSGVLPLIALRLPTEWERPLPSPGAPRTYNPESFAAAVRRDDPFGTKPTRDVAVGHQLCSASPSTAYSAVRWTLRPDRAAKGTPSFRNAWIVENLNTLVVGGGAIHLDNAIATNALGDIVATGYPVGAGGKPGARRVYLLRNLDGQPPDLPVVTPPTPKPAAVLACFPNGFSATWSSGPSYLPQSCNLAIQNGRAISICGATGAVSPDGTFKAMGGGLTISGKLNLDKNNMVTSSVQQASYTATMTTGMLTLTPL
jgi:phospholipase C